MSSLEPVTSKDINELPQEEVKKMLGEISKKQQTVYEKKLCIVKINTEIKEIEKILYKKCKHKWAKEQYDTGPYDDRWYICSICNLYRNKYFYT